MAGPKVLKSKVFTTPAFRAVFPDLNKPDKYGSYKVDVDASSPVGEEIEAAVRAQIAELLPKATDDFGIDPETTIENDPVRVGEQKDGTPFRRLSFKMKSTKKVKGTEVEVRPRLVDAHRQPIDPAKTLIFGGSLVKAAYYIQATLVNGSFYMTAKLNSVQVLEHVGPGAEVSVDTLFEDEDGFSADYSTATSTPDVPVEAADDDSGALAAANY